MNTTQVAAGIAAGRAGPVVPVTLSEFNSIYEAILSRVSADEAAVAVALVDGDALVAFPRLGPQTLRVRELKRHVQRKDFEFPTAAPRTIAGGDAQGFADLLTADVAATRWPVIMMLIATIGVFVAGASSRLIGALGPSLVVASGLFVTVFVLFGIGEIIRSQDIAKRLFIGGVLQTSLDADKYLVRIAIVGFVASISAVTVRALSPKLVQVARAQGLEVSPLLDGIGLGLLFLGAAALILAFRATLAYLLDRAAHLALTAAADEVLRDERNSAPAEARERLGRS